MNSFFSLFLGMILYLQCGAVDVGEISADTIRAVRNLNLNFLNNCSWHKNEPNTIITDFIKPAIT